MGREENNKAAYVTVYYVLSLMIIISLLLISLESARLRAAKARSAYSLDMALKSVMADYYGPLYDEYHILAVDGGYGNTMYSREAIAEHVGSMLKRNYENVYSSGVICNNQNISITVTDVVTLASDDGAAFFNQAVSYQKYRVAGDIIEMLLERAGLADMAAKAQEMIAKRTEAEKEIAAVDTELVKLIELVDGISLKGLLENGQTSGLNINRPFVRIITSDEGGTGVNNTDFSKKVKRAQYNPDEVYDTAMADAEEYVVALKAVDNCSAFIEEKTTEKEFIEERLIRLGLDEDIIEAERIIKEEVMELMILQIQEELDDAAARIKILEAYAALRKLNFQNVISTAYRMADGIMEKCDLAEDTVENIYEHFAEAEKKAELYSGCMETGRHLLGEGAYNNIEDEINILYEYVSGNNGIFPADLDMVCSIVTQVHEAAESFAACSGIDVIPSTDEELQVWKENAGNAFAVLRGCENTAQWIDYSQITVIEKDVKLLEFVNTLVNGAFAEMVFEDSEKISDSSIDITIYPSYFYDCKKFMVLSFESIFSSLSFENPDETYDSVADMSVLETISETGEEIVNKALLLAYIEEHFNAYDSDEMKERIFSYEQEYLLAGYSKDSSNIELVVCKLMTIRFIMNFIFAITDSACNTNAQGLATALLGFTGFTGLVMAAKYIIFMLWAFEAAVVDTAALIEGYEVPLWVGTDGLSVRFNELLLFTKKNIHVYKERYSTGAAGGIGLEYRDYMRIFMFIMEKETLCFRMMDLIQANLGSAYEEYMYVWNGVVELEVTIKDLINKHFTGINLFRYDMDNDGYYVNTTQRLGYD